MIAETGTSGTDNSESFETFDNFNSEELEDNRGIEDDWSSDVDEEEESPKKSKKETVKDDLKVIKDSQLDEDGEVIDEEEDSLKTKKKDEDDEEEEKEEKEEEEETDEEKPKSPKSDAKKLRMKMGDELFNVDSNATFKVKVDGDLQEVPLQELINNYSGKTAWDKKFTDLGKERKAHELEVANLTTKQRILADHLTTITSTIKDANKNPLDALMYIVELSGEDPYTAYRRIMESNLDELSNLMDMSETERELYFHKKKDELHTSVAKKRQDMYQREQSFNQAVQKVDALRQSYNVSEDQFVDASEELESIYKEAGLDVNNITEEVVVDYASLRPHIETVKELIAPYEENIAESKYGDVVSNFARYLRDGKADLKTVKEILKRNFSVEEDVKELNTRVYKKQEKSPKSRTLNEGKKKDFETFDDDWD